MKLPSKHIALVVVLSLAAIFAYQAYWLVNLYRTQCRATEHDIAEALRLSDYNEIILRVEQMSQDSLGQHGEVSVSAGYSADTPYVESRTITTRQAGDSLDTTLQVQRDTAAIDASLHTNDMGFLFGRKNTMQELAGYFQRGLHAGLDVIHDPDFATYDSLLCDELHRADIIVPYRLTHLHQGDTLATGGTPGYTPSPEAKTYEYSYDLHGKWLYLLTTEPLDGYVLRQMAGILATSAVIPADGGHPGHVGGHPPRPGLLLLVPHPHPAAPTHLGGDEGRLHQQHDPRTEDAHRRGLRRQRRPAELRRRCRRDEAHALPPHLPGATHAAGRTGGADSLPLHGAAAQLGGTASACTGRHFPSPTSSRPSSSSTS